MNFAKKILYGLLIKHRGFNYDFYAKIHFEYYHNKKLNLDEPMDYNEKIHWLKARYHEPELTAFADKFLVRSYVKEKVGDQYLNELYGVYKKPSEIDFNELPDQFVIKATHGSNMNLIVPNKSKMKKFKSLLLMKKWLRRNYYYHSGQEWVYKNMEPKLIIEKLLATSDEKRIVDYKFFCFNGEPKFAKILTNKKDEKGRWYYDMNWKKLEIYTKYNPIGEGELEQPLNFGEMKSIARKLSDRLPFVRVDLYSVHGKTIFGEMTFYPTDGREDFLPQKMNRVIGDYIKLPF